MSSLFAIRRFAGKRPDVERCELCGKELGPEHQHVIEPANRRLSCCCDACAILFGGTAGKYRRVPREVSLLSDFKMSDAEWESLHLPISLAFFYRSSPAKRVIAMFPGPAGATESLLTLDAWEDLVYVNPVLLELQPDVEALLVNRVGPIRDYFRVPIDECFKLVGLIRTHWRGLSGGTEVWRELAAFSDALKRRSAGTGGCGGGDA
jgi:hypothetical protein